MTEDRRRADPLGLGGSPLLSAILAKDAPARRSPAERARSLGWDVCPAESPNQRGLDLARLYKRLNEDAEAWRGKGETE